MAAASAHSDVSWSSAASFGDVWAQRIYPVIRSEYVELMKTTPWRMNAKHGEAIEKKQKKEKKTE